VDVTGHDTDLAFVGLDDTRAVGTNNSGNVLASQGSLNSDHILLRNTISDDDNEFELSFNGFQDSVLSTNRGDIDDGSVGTGGLDGFLAISKNGETAVSGSSLLGVNTTDHLGAVL